MPERPKIALILGSDSDWPVMEAAYKLLGELGLETEVLVASAHRSPEAVRLFVEKAEGLSAIIAAAGAAAHLAGAVAAHTILPVIGVPLSGSALNGLDALLSMAQMPPGVPVGVMAVDGARNAALFAAAIAALGDRETAARLRDFRGRQTEGVAAKNAALQDKLRVGLSASARKT